MKIPVKITQFLPILKDRKRSPFQSSGVDEPLSLFPFRRIQSVHSINFKLAWLHSVEKIFRQISTCNFFYTSIDAYEFFSQVRKEPLKLHYTQELRSLELTLALVQINRNILNR